MPQHGQARPRAKSNHATRIEQVGLRTSKVGFHTMPDSRLAILVLAVIALLVTMILAEQANCKNEDGSPCKFGRAGRSSIFIQSD